MLDDLVKLKKITVEQRDMYVLFTHELGRKVLDRMMYDTFMVEAERDSGGVGFAFNDGRRSVIRDIHNALIFIESEIRKLEHDGSS